MIAQVRGSFNALSVFGSAVGHTMTFGRGAGQFPTASAVVSDILNVASGWYPEAFAKMDLWPADFEPAELIDPDHLSCRYYIRVNAMDEPGVMAKVTTALGDVGISVSAVIQHESNVGRFVPLAITTHDAPEGSVRNAIAAIKAMDVIEGEPVCIRIVEMPEG